MRIQRMGAAVRKTKVHNPHKQMSKLEFWRWVFPASSQRSAGNPGAYVLVLKLKPTAFSEQKIKTNAEGKYYIQGIPLSSFRTIGALISSDVRATRPVSTHVHAHAHALKTCVHNAVVPADGAHTKVNFLERLHKMLREKRCDE